MPPMGCAWSQRNRPQKDYNNVRKGNERSICSSRSNGSSQPPQHFRSKGMNSKRRSSSTESLKLGSITEIWKKTNEWNKFVHYLDAMDEGCDSDGQKMSLGRYARFLELYVRLDQAERVEGRSEEELKGMVMQLRDHNEDFFGTERCLRCIDSGMRRQVLENLKKVRRGEVKAGTWVYQPVYPRVLDKLNELVGSYNIRK